jgi:hypothetical protein
MTPAGSRTWHLRVMVLIEVACHHSHAPAAAPDAAADAATEGSAGAPTCEDGTHAFVFDSFQGSADAACSGAVVDDGSLTLTNPGFTSATPNGTNAMCVWNVFADEVSAPPSPVTGVIVHVATLDNAGIGLDFWGPGGNDGSANWFRWSVVGVDTVGPVIDLAASSDGSTWSDVESTDQLGIGFTLVTGVGCYIPPSPEQPPPCGSQTIELADAVWVCPQSP